VEEKLALFGMVKVAIPRLIDDILESRYLVKKSQNGKTWVSLARYVFVCCFNVQQT
jgi:hypothetical protein